MGKKRKNEDTEEKIRRKIRKLEGKLRRKNKAVIYSSDEEVENPVVIPTEDDLLGDIYPPLTQTQEPDLANVDLSHTDVPRVDSSPMPGPSGEPTEPAVATGSLALDDEILNILGDAPKAETSLGDNIHKDIAERWQEILAKGLPKDVKEKVMAEYLVPSNCDLLVPPILNPEAKAALPEALVKRDSIIMLKQKQIGIALAALAQATELIVSEKISKREILKPISDASRLLCDSHNTETKTRRSFVINSINSTLKETLIDTSRDKFLFGENVTEKLKVAKSIQRSGDVLKNQPKQQNRKNFFINKDKSKNTTLNYKALHPKQVSRLDAGPFRPAPRSAASRPPPPPRRQRSPPPPPQRRAPFARR